MATVVWPMPSRLESDWKLETQMGETCRRVGTRGEEAGLPLEWALWEGVDPPLQLEAGAPTSGCLPFSSIKKKIRVNRSKVEYPEA